jgi:hypothetical protein
MLQTGRKLSAMQAVRPAQGAFMIDQLDGRHGAGSIAGQSETDDTTALHA